MLSLLCAWVVSGVSRGVSGCFWRARAKQRQKKETSRLQSKETDRLQSKETDRLATCRPAVKAAEASRGRPSPSSARPLRP